MIGLCVAPFTGAWIETEKVYLAAQYEEVAPFTGAWIETSSRKRDQGASLSSHPSRVRGLKLVSSMLSIYGTIESHPSRVRGLKPLIAD